MPKCRTPGCNNDVDFYNDRCEKCYDELGDLIEEHPIGSPLGLHAFVGDNPQNRPIIHDMRRMPDLTKQPLNHVDGTPNKDYPIRILKSFRENCNCHYTSSSDGSEDGLSEFMKEMNRNQEKRAKILDEAIAILSREMR